MLFYFILQKNMPIGNLLIASLEEAFKCALFYLIKYPYSLLVILNILDIKLCQFLQTKTFFFSLLLYQHCLHHLLVAFIDSVTRLNVIFTIFGTTLGRF